MRKDTTDFHSPSLFTRVYMCKSDWRPLWGQCQHHLWVGRMLVNKGWSSSITIADALKFRQIHRTSGTIWSGRFILANTRCSLILCECGCGATQINRTVVKYWHSMSLSLLTDGKVFLSHVRSSVSGLLTFIYFNSIFRWYRWYFLLKFKLFWDK